MGGAIALMLHRKEPTFWDGAILVAPMCKVKCPRLANLVFAASVILLLSRIFRDLQSATPMCYHELLYVGKFNHAWWDLIIDVVT